MFYLKIGCAAKLLELPLVVFNLYNFLQPLFATQSQAGSVTNEELVLSSLVKKLYTAGPWTCLTARPMF